MTALSDFIISFIYSIAKILFGDEINLLISSDLKNSDNALALAVDSKKWNYTPRGDVAHAYYYKPNDTSVVWCEDGLLNLKFMKDETDPRGYKSGSIRTDSGKFDFTYGKVEIKAKFSSGNGSWPAIWMMPASSEYGGWLSIWNTAPEFTAFI